MKQNSGPQRSQFTVIFFAFAFGMIFSNLLQTQQLETSHTALQEILFVYRGIEKNLSDLVEQDRQKIAELDQQKIHAIETAALRQYFLDEAKQQHHTVEEISKRLLKWEAITDEDVSRFYEQHEKSLQKPFYEVKHHIRQTLEQQRVSKARQTLIDDLINRGDLAILPIR